MVCPQPNLCASYARETPRSHSLKTEFWELLNKLYEVHDAFKKCVPYYPTAAEICREIEDFILELQQKTTLPQQYSVEELTKQGAV